MSFSNLNGQKPKLVVVSSNASAEKQIVVQNSVAKHLVYSQIIKSENFRGTHSSDVKINHFIPSEVVGKRAAVLPAGRTSSHSQSRLAVDGLKQNLKVLNDLQARLRFMLTELEDLVQKS
jgi:hypothetical protein